MVIVSQVLTSSAVLTRFFLALVDVQLANAARESGVGTVTLEAAQLIDALSIDARR